MGPTPVYGARGEKLLKNADFAMKQTNICRLSGDIKNSSATRVRLSSHDVTVSHRKVTTQCLIRCSDVARI